MKTGIIGSGAMGSGIAQVLAGAGHEVTVYDNNPEAVLKAEARLKDTMALLTAKGKFTQEKASGLLSRIRFVPDFDALADASLIIEAIVEKLEVKQAVFRELEEIASPECALATNTSSLSVTAIAAACAHPGRVFGLHFFNPAPVMQLVEVIPAAQTDRDRIKRAVSWVKEWGKIPVMARNTPGFIVNRVARPYYSEALRILDEGLADPATIDRAMTHFGGFRMGPFALMDFIGHDVNYAVTESVYRASFHEPRYKPSFTQKDLVEAGFLGKKAGRGFYDYRPEAPAPVPSEDGALGQMIFKRILVMLINEAADALHFGIAEREDIDLAMTKGVNYPKGLLAWAEEIGVGECARMMDELYDFYREDRYRCSPWLRKNALQKAP